MYGKPEERESETVGMVKGGKESRGPLWEIWGDVCSASSCRLRLLVVIQIQWRIERGAQAGICGAVGVACSLVFAWELDRRKLV